MSIVGLKEVDAMTREEWIAYRDLDALISFFDSHTPTLSLNESLPPVPRDIGRVMDALRPQVLPRLQQDRRETSGTG